MSFSLLDRMLLEIGFFKLFLNRIEDDLWELSRIDNKNYY